MVEPESGVSSGVSGILDDLPECIVLPSYVWLLECGRTLSILARGNNNDNTEPSYKRVLKQLNAQNSRKYVGQYRPL